VYAVRNMRPEIGLKFFPRFASSGVPKVAGEFFGHL